MLTFGGTACAPPTTTRTPTLTERPGYFLPFLPPCPSPSPCRPSCPWPWPTGLCAWRLRRRLGRRRPSAPAALGGRRSWPVSSPSSRPRRGLGLASGRPSAALRGRRRLGSPSAAAGFAGACHRRPRRRPRCGCAGPGGRARRRRRPRSGRPAGPEGRHRGRRHLHGLAGARVAPDPGRPRPALEDPETGERHRLRRPDGVHDGLEQAVDPAAAVRRSPIRAASASTSWVLFMT